jgi:hypothetical protein
MSGSRDEPMGSCRPHPAKIPVPSWIIAMLFLVPRKALLVKPFFTERAAFSV